MATYKYRQYITGVNDSIDVVFPADSNEIVITKNVPEKSVMVGIPAKNVGIADSEFKPYGITPDSDTKSDQ